MDVRPIHNEQDYDWAVREVTRYFEAEPALGTPDGDRFEVLSSLIKEYEDKNFATPHGDPVDVLHLRLNQWENRKRSLPVSSAKTEPPKF